MDRNLYNRVRIKSADELAVERDNRLQNCGLLYHENQSTNKGYVGPPERRITGNGPRFTIEDNLSQYPLAVQRFL